MYILCHGMLEVSNFLFTLQGVTVKDCGDLRSWAKCIWHHEMALSLRDTGVEWDGLNEKGPHKFLYSNTWSHFWRKDVTG